MTIDFDCCVPHMNGTSQNLSFSARLILLVHGHHDREHSGRWACRQASRQATGAIAKSLHLSDPQAGIRKRKSKVQSPPLSNTPLPRPHLLILSKQIL